MKRALITGITGQRNPFLDLAVIVQNLIREPHISPVVDRQPRRRIAVGKLGISYL